MCFFNPYHLFSGPPIHHFHACHKLSFRPQLGVGIWGLLQNGGSFHSKGLGFPLGVATCTGKPRATTKNHIRRVLLFRQGSLYAYLPLGSCVLAFLGCLHHGLLGEPNSRLRFGESGCQVAGRGGRPLISELNSAKNARVLSLLIRANAHGCTTGLDAVHSLCRNRSWKLGASSPPKRGETTKSCAQKAPPVGGQKRRFRESLFFSLNLRSQNRDVDPTKAQRCSLRFPFPI